MGCGKEGGSKEKYDFAFVSQILKSTLVVKSFRVKLPKLYTIPGLTRATASASHTAILF